MRKIRHYQFGTFVPLPPTPATSSAGSPWVTPRRGRHYQLTTFVPLPIPETVSADKWLYALSEPPRVRQPLPSAVRQVFAIGLEPSIFPLPPPLPPPPPAAGPSALSLASVRLGETNERLDKVLTEIRHW